MYTNLGLAFRHGRCPIVQAKHNEPTCRLCTGFSSGGGPTKEHARTQGKIGSAGGEEEKEEEGAAAMRKSDSIFMHFSQTKKVIIKII